MGTTLLLLKISANISAYFLATPEFSFFRFSERMLVQNFSYKNKLTLIFLNMNVQVLTHFHMNAFDAGEN